ncbi:MAG TPA: protein-export chaperone SecB [Gammaproteobacteria bacterium]|nr:protein-export chaperone SecB [Gammaproteobacteria bacterium]
MPESPIDVSRDFQPQPPGGEFTIKKIYCKDVSFETPNSPAIFRSEWKPDAELQLRTEAREVSPGEYEVVLMVTVTLSVGENTAFLAEVNHAGIFGITGLNSDQMGRTLGSYCPSILFPYSREMVSELVIRGGFPPFILAPVNFDALYRKHLAGKSEEQPAAPKSQNRTRSG